MFLTIKEFILKHYYLIIPLVIAAIFSWLHKAHYFEDALIYARYIDNFLDGHGLVYNKGVIFNGLTSPLFTYLSIILSYIIGNTLYAINFISAFFLLLSIFIYGRLFSEVSNKIYALVGSMFVSFSPYTYSIFGMETLLFIFLIGASIYLFINNKYNYLFFVLVLLILTRSEGVFLIMALVFEHFRLKRSLPYYGDLILPFMLFLLHFIITYIYYGAFLPETASAKIWQGKSGLFGDPPFLFLKNSGYIVNWYFSESKLLLISFIALSLVGFYSLKDKSLNIILVVFLFLLLLFYNSLNIPNYHWYNAPFIIIMFYYSSIGVFFTMKVFAKKTRYSHYIVHTLLIGTLFSVLFIFYNQQKLGDPQHPYKEVANWINDNLEGSPSIAMVEIGVIGYFTNADIIDILGLVNPYNAKYIGDRDFNKWLEKYQPDYIFVHDPPWAHEKSIETATKSGNYLEYNKFNMEGYKLFSHKRINRLEIM